MPTLLTVTGRDVCFAHWPVEPDRLAPAIPDPLELDTFDGSAWVSALALENPSVAPGTTTLPEGFGPAFPQLNLRTYVTVDGDPGVYFLSLDSGRRAPATLGRRAFGLPFHHARMRLTRRGEEVTFRSRREGAPPAVFRARYRPTGDPSPADPGSLAAFCVERFRYYLPAPEDRRAGAFRSPGDDAGDGTPGVDRESVYVGEIRRDPWRLAPAGVRIRENTLFETAGLPAPAADPVFQYSPGFEMGVEPVAVHRPDDPATGDGTPG